jgi:GT2 family glycosyltransferase
MRARSPRRRTGTGTGTAEGRVLVVIPVYGQHELTRLVLSDLDRERDITDVVVVDNAGDYVSAGRETVLQPGSNLGWAGGTNLGTTRCLTAAHTGVLWLNNDTRLSDRFVRGLRDAASVTGAGIVGPAYDCFWQHQRLRRVVPVDRYRARSRHDAVPFVDGTAMFVTSGTIAAIGVLDAEAFGAVGWGADLDYCLRARSSGIGVVVTRLAFLHHEKSATGKAIYGSLEGYASEGHEPLQAGMEAKWGAAWRDLVAIDPSTGQTVTAGRSFDAKR